MLSRCRNVEGLLAHDQGRNAGNHRNFTTAAFSARSGTSGQGQGRPSASLVGPTLRALLAKGSRGRRSQGRLRRYSTKMATTAEPPHLTSTNSALYYMQTAFDLSNVGTLTCVSIDTRYVAVSNSRPWRASLSTDSIPRWSMEEWGENVVQAMPLALSQPSTMSPAAGPVQEAPRVAKPVRRSPLRPQWAPVIGVSCCQRVTLTSSSATEMVRIPTQKPR